MGQVPMGAPQRQRRSVEGGLRGLAELYGSTRRPPPGGRSEPRSLICRLVRGEVRLTVLSIEE